MPEIGLLENGGFQMQIARFMVLVLLAGVAARADFSYTQTRKANGGMIAAGPQTTKVYLKGQKMMTDMGNSAMIIDFDAQTITGLDKLQKTYSVTPFSQIGQGMSNGPEITVDFKETGAKKEINGFNASQGIMTMQMEIPGRGNGMKMQMEMEFWVSPDVPGAKELRAFYQRNMGKFPWSALAHGGNPSAEKAMAEVQRHLAAMNGVPVLQIMRVKPVGGDPAQSQQMQAGMAQARQRLEAMAAQGGPQADAARQALARMNAMSGGGGVLSETTVESSAFSTDSVPESVFAIPAGYQKKDQQ
jgi:hypothetical protein